MRIVRRCQRENVAEGMGDVVLLVGIGGGQVWGTEKFRWGNTLCSFGCGYRFEFKNRMNIRLALFQVERHLYICLIHNLFLCLQNYYIASK